MNKELTHSPPAGNKNKANFADFLALPFKQDPVFHKVRDLAVADGGFTWVEATHMGHYASVIGAVLKWKRTTAYQVAQRLLARVVCGFYGLRVHSRQYANRIELMLERLGLVEIPKYRTNVDSPPKVRRATDLFCEMLSIRATESCISSRQVKSIAKETPRTIVNSNPIREGFAHRKGPTLFDSNHRKALEKRGVVQSRLPRRDRQFIFHCQKAVPDSLQALFVYVDTIRRRESGDAETVEWFARWEKTPKRYKADAIARRFGLGVSPRGLTEKDRQFLYYCQVVERDLHKSICLFVDTVRHRVDGDEAVRKFFNNWGDLTRWSKPGYVREIATQLGYGEHPRLPAPAVRAGMDSPLPQKGLDGAVTILYALADTMSAEEHRLLSNSLLFNEPYQGCHADILQRLQDMSTSG